MELHGENKFKTRSYSNAAFQIGRLGQPLNDMPYDKIESINGIGKNIAAKVNELITTGSLSYLEEYFNKTPKGVVEMLSIKGIGPSKIRLLWQEMGIESPGELLQACEENRLVEIKGFGEKTQTQIRDSIKFRISNEGIYHFAVVEPLAKEVETALKDQFGELVTPVGEYARKEITLTKIEFLIGNAPEDLHFDTQIPVELHFCESNDFYRQAVMKSATVEHVEMIGDIPIREFSDEKEVYASVNKPFVIPEMRVGVDEFNRALNPESIISLDQIKGSLHNHTNWSDGMHTMEEMAQACINKGWQYFGVCDHSKTAVYANGLNEERIAAQHAQIEELNATYSNFKILKGIESDILYDGQLDYSEDVLKTFDFVVASVHSQLKMDEHKANERLIKAIENPYTSILGHPTGRLLLSRKGYPINHKKIIDACAANNVVLELNANPLRLDIDWTWISYALEQGVMISINPDAHNVNGFDHTYYGVCAARKGGLTTDMTLNALSLEEITTYFKNQKI